MASSSTRAAIVQWRIVPLECPRILRHCSPCGRTRPFSCSEKFRVNAQKRRVDVWLLYRCCACGGSWKATVFERRLPADIAGFEDYQNNRTSLARAYAFDRAWLGRFGHDIDDDVAFRVEAADAGPTLCRRIALAFEHPFRVRLDRLLAVGLRTSRATVAKLWKRGSVVRLNGQPLRCSAKHGELIDVRAESGSPEGG